ncbi:cell wall hydrolase [Pseudoneobacillus sp. C159]
MRLLIATLTILIGSLLFAVNITYAYTVKQGDTMIGIAEEHNLSLGELADLNPQIDDLNVIFAGDKLQTKLPEKTVEITFPERTTKEGYEIYIGKIVDTVEPQTAINLMMKPIDEMKKQKETNTEKPKLEKAKVKHKLTENEIDLLARLVRAEAQVEPFHGKVAVACVVLNRLESSHFPDSIREVIYEPGQFQPVRNGEINKPADEESIAAVKAALTEQRHAAKKSLFFYNPKIATSRWLDTRSTTLVIGQHVFKK